MRVHSLLGGGWAHTEEYVGYRTCIWSISTFLFQYILLTQEIDLLVKVAGPQEVSGCSRTSAWPDEFETKCSGQILLLCNALALPKTQLIFWILLCPTSTNTQLHPPYEEWAIWVFLKNRHTCRTWRIGSHFQGETIALAQSYKALLALFLCCVQNSKFFIFSDDWEETVEWRNPCPGIFSKGLVRDL